MEILTFYLLRGKIGKVTYATEIKTVKKIPAMELLRYCKIPQLSPIKKDSAVIQYKEKQQASE